MSLHIYQLFRFTKQRIEEMEFAAASGKKDLVREFCRDLRRSHVLEVLKETPCAIAVPMDVHLLAWKVQQLEALAHPDGPASPQYESHMAQILAHLEVMARFIQFSATYRQPLPEVPNKPAATKKRKRKNEKVTSKRTVPKR